MASAPERVAPEPPTRSHIPTFLPSRPPPPRPDLPASPARPRRQTGEKQPVPEPPSRPVVPILLYQARPPSTETAATNTTPRSDESATTPRQHDAVTGYDEAKGLNNAEYNNTAAHNRTAEGIECEQSQQGYDGHVNVSGNSKPTTTTTDGDDHYNDHDNSNNNDNDVDDDDDDDDDASFLETLSLASVRNSMNLDDELSRDSGSFGSLPFSELAPEPPPPPPVAPRTPQTSHRSSNSSSDSFYSGSSSGDLSRESSDRFSPTLPDRSAEHTPPHLHQQQQQPQPQQQQQQEGVVEQPVDHRTKIVAELIETERVYIGRMGVIIDVYMEPLQAADCKVTAGMAAGWMGQVFSNIEAIRQFHQNLYARLADERFAQWDKDCTKIADIFVTLSPYLKLYLQYCNNYDAAMSTFTALRKKHPLFDRYLIEQREHPGCLDRMQLEHLLISPVQRIPRYILLLRDLLKHTAPEHPDFADIGAAITHVQAIANSLDQRIGDVEKANHVLDIQSRVSGCPEIVHPSRYLVREGAATLCRFETSSISNAGADQKVTFYLFNDSLLAATVSGQVFKGMVMFLDTSTLLRDLPDIESMQNAFYLVSRDVNWTIRFVNTAEKLQWLLDIQTQIDATREIQRTRTRTIASASQATPRVHITAQITATQQIKPERKTESEYTVYHLSTCIDISGHPPLMHTTTRRFREFSDLHAAMKQQYPQHRFSPLPAKKAFGTLSQKTIENRRIMLEICLNDFLAKDDVAQDPRLLLFLAVSQEELQQILEPAPAAPIVSTPTTAPEPSPTPTPPPRPPMFGPAMSIDLSELRKVQTSRLRQHDDN